MLQLTKRTEYGLIALTHLARRAGDVVSVRELGERFDLPRRLLAEVLKDLLHAGIVDSQLGASGGYRLARPAARVSLGEVVAALEGSPAVTVCGSTAGPVGAGGAAVLRECDLEPRCPIRSPLQVIRARIRELLDSTTLESLTRDAHRAVPVLAGRTTRATLSQNR